MKNDTKVIPGDLLQPKIGSSLAQQCTTKIFLLNPKADRDVKVLTTRRVKTARLGLGWVLGLVLSLGNQAHAQLTVAAPITDALLTTNQAQTIAQLAQQLQQLQRQYQQMQQQYAAVTGSRGLGSLVGQPALANLLPPDWSQQYQQMIAAGPQALTGSASTIYQQSKIGPTDPCAAYTNANEQTLCQTQQVAGAVQQGRAVDQLQVLQGRLGQMNSLASQINQTQDPKAIAELQADFLQVQGEMQAQALQLQLAREVEQAQEKLDDARQHQLFLQELNKD